MQADSMQTVWERQYGPEVDSALKDTNLFRLEVNAILREMDVRVSGSKPLKILEIGCGTGALLEAVGERFADQKRDVLLHGVDFASTAIDKAKTRQLPNCEFYCSDVLRFLEKRSKQYDVVVSQRVVMALMDRQEQRALLQAIKDCLSDTGVALLSECFAGKFNEFNAARAILGLPPLEKVWHSLHLEEADVRSVFRQVSFNDFCSTYMLVTRIIYPYFEEPKHNQPIHDFASALPQAGSLGFLRLAVAHP